jgi:type I restriction enzyme S subunit
MVIKEGYKQTEIGVIPNDWVVKTISEFTTPVRGGSPRPAGDPKYFNGDFIPWLTVASLTNIPISQIFVSETDNYLTEAGSFHSRILDKETLIIANSGATLGVAKLLSIKCCANDGIAALLDFDKDISKSYVVYFINTKIKYLREVVATGNGQPNLNTDLIGKIQIPLPPSLLEQAAIATALSDVDRLITGLEKLIAKKRNIKQGAMQQLLQPKEGWEVMKLGEVCDIEKGKQLNRSTLNQNDTYPVLNGGVSPSGYTNAFNQIENTIIISEGGNSCGFVNFIKTKFWQGGHCYSLKTKHNKDLLFQILKYYEKNIMALRVGSGLPNIQKSRLYTFEIPIPISDKEQTRIATILSDMDAELSALEQKLEKYKKVKLGMMQELLTGKTRLV